MRGANCAIGCGPQTLRRRLRAFEYAKDNLNFPPSSELRILNSEYHSAYSICSEIRSANLSLCQKVATNKRARNEAMTGEGPQVGQVPSDSAPGRLPVAIRELSQLARHIG